MWSKWSKKKLYVLSHNQFFLSFCWDACLPNVYISTDACTCGSTECAVGPGQQCDATSGTPVCKSNFFQIFIIK